MKGGKLRSSYKLPPAVAVISVDAGKAQFRAEEMGPGVHEARWGDTKVACLQTYTNVGYDKDPQPEPPGEEVEVDGVDSAVAVNVDVQEVGSVGEFAARNAVAVELLGWDRSSMLIWSSCWTST